MLTYGYQIINASRYQNVRVLALWVNVELEIRLNKPHPLLDSTLYTVKELVQEVNLLLDRG